MAEINPERNISKFGKHGFRSPGPHQIRRSHEQRDHCQRCKHRAYLPLSRRHPVASEVVPPKSNDKLQAKATDENRDAEAEPSLHQAPPARPIEPDDVEEEPGREYPPNGWQVTARYDHSRIGNQRKRRHRIDQDWASLQGPEEQGRQHDHLGVHE